MTGLSRREVTRVKNVLLGEEVLDGPPEDRISHVLTNWHFDAEFCDGDGSPALLPETGERSSFEALLKRYAGDTPHGALKKELLQLGLVVAEESKLRVTARSYVRSQSDPDLIRQAGVTLHDHASTVVHNCNRPERSPARFDRMATSVKFPADRVDDFRALVERKGQDFLEEIDTWLAQQQVSDGGAQDRSVRTGVGVFLIHDDCRGT
jgi:hypothetical protein